ncbi:J domain-containing protein [Candidatus Viridilinea mediisalina]|uniref:J domain-containing protein n=1 Tax=Candidatus Viridilinea mediisalina TaxID=2024553 RepID=A0A2A6RNQ0_9CHLR|nr:J domain-containing protein [Candidatus Viridilinea mediisalina]PDW04508.1 hypothetical protein CJ255_03055 [Candidatus Viridilinea mediisalina]
MSTVLQENPYAILGVNRDAPADEIKRAYFTLVRANPPERNPVEFKRIRAAYELLRDPAKQVETDLQLLQLWPEPARRKRTPKPSFVPQTDDILAVLRASSDLERSDWREHYKKMEW